MMTVMADLPNSPSATTADDHLAKLLVDVEIPWYRTFLHNLKDFFHPPKLPPLELTSKPIAVDEIWGLYGRQKKSFLMSTGVQMGAVAIVLLLGTNKTVQQAVKHNILFMPIDVAPPELKMKPVPQISQAGGGGGGDRSPLPASYGKLPKFALRQFTPPVAVYNNPNPKLAMEPTLIGDPNTEVANIDYPLYGNPLSHYTTPSNGTGSGGGIGNTKGGGAGSGNGAGFGPGDGSGGGVSGTVFHMGDGVTAPVLVSKVDPEYSEDGREKHRQGTVLVAAEINTSGQPVGMHVIRSLGLGLDEEALQALKQWKFLPAKKNGKPVAVEIQVGVTFRLL
jgi:TonB family protein